MPSKTSLPASVSSFRSYLQRLRPAPKTCPFRKSYPDVLMMQSGQDRNDDNETGPVNSSMQ